jgi:hypothetical protein
LAIQNTFESVLLWQNTLKFICWACSRKTLLCVCGRGNSDNCVGSQQRQQRGQATAAVAEAARGQTINQKAGGHVAGGGGDGGSRGSGSGNGDGGNGGDNAAAMSAVTAAPIWHRQWQRGRPMWAEVIFCITNLHKITYRCDNAKHFSILFGKTLQCFAKHFSVFNLFGLFVEHTFGRRLIFSKMR